MNKSIITLIIGIFFLLVPNTAEAQYGTYGEIFFGSAKQIDTGVDYGSDTSYGFWGGIPITDMIAAEIGYANYGGPTLTDGFDILSIKTTALNFGARFQVPIDDNFGVHARLGLALWELEFGGDFIGSYDDSNIYFGFGGDIKISESASILLDYHSLSCEVSGVSGSLDVTNLSVGIGFEF
jgi:hypothetical protein